MTSLFTNLTERPNDGDHMTAIWLAGCMRLSVAFDESDSSANSPILNPIRILSEEPLASNEI